MTKDDLAEALSREIEEWKKKDYSEVALIDFSRPLVWESEVCEFRYWVEVELLDKNEEFIHVGICANSGGLSQLLPKARSIVYYRDGRVDA